jgi:hypothetical protein
MPARHRIVLLATLAVVLAACGSSTSPTVGPTVSITVSSETIAVGDTVAATAVGRQSQNFLYYLQVLGTFANDTLGLRIDSTPGGSASITLRQPVVAPQSAVGQYIYFTAYDSAYNFPRATAVDSVYVTQ